ncbi:DUF6221 family protein [Streptomyces sp. B21-083]|uniref:DUF6221 family protein n=1 Tax=Streptomyces sp. B21-083 TaxID=3039410 RepID=UPI002FEF2C34
MDDLVQWYGACLDDEERVARAAAEDDGPGWHYDGRAVLTCREGDMVAVGSQDFMEAERGTHIAAHDPARVLRDIDGRRRTLLRCQEAMPAANPMLVHFAKQTVREMARSFSHLPGYEKALASFE